MFDLSLAELALIVIVSVVFIGPKDLPAVLRAVAKAVRAARALGKELQAAFDELSRESGMKDASDDIAKNIRMIEGDDGRQYESYDISHMLPREKPHER